MITRSELQYVNSWAQKCPYPGRTYAENVADKLIASFNDYKEYYQNKMFNIILSNGEELSFEIKEKNLCHMLGIDYKNLKGEYFDAFRKDVLGLDSSINSWVLLEAIINNIDKVLDYDERYSIILNYYRIMIKNAIFEKLSDFSRFNFGVLNLSKDIANNRGYNIALNSEKLLYFQSNEPVAPYFMMGVLKDGSAMNQNEGSYAVETLMAPTEPKQFFDNQEASYPTQIQVVDDKQMKILEASPSEKLALLNQYRLIIKEYQLRNKLNINGDYEAMLAASASKSKKLELIK